MAICKAFHNVFNGPKRRRVNHTRISTEPLEMRQLLTGWLGALGGGLSTPNDQIQATPDKTADTSKSSRPSTEDSTRTEHSSTPSPEDLEYDPASTLPDSPEKTRAEELKDEAFKKLDEADELDGRAERERAREKKAREYFDDLQRDIKENRGGKTDSGNQHLLDTYSRIESNSRENAEEYEEKAKALRKEADELCKESSQIIDNLVKDRAQEARDAAARADALAQAEFDRIERERKAELNRLEEGNREENREENRQEESTDDESDETEQDTDASATDGFFGGTDGSEFDGENPDDDEVNEEEESSSLNPIALLGKGLDYFSGVVSTYLQKMPVLGPLLGGTSSLVTIKTLGNKANKIADSREQRAREAKARLIAAERAKTSVEIREVQLGLFRRIADFALEAAGLK